MQGILHPDDAVLAVEHGADGIIVSNHGGRQLDTAITTVDALPGIARAVNRRIPVLVDGGIQTGSDVIKVMRPITASLMNWYFYRLWQWVLRQS